MKYQKRLLIVDDNETLRKVLKSSLEPLGFTIELASDAEMALEHLKKEDFDVILSDIQMPNINGIELLSRVREMKNTPFVLMTGFSDLAETIEGDRLGAEFITKPFKRDELLRIFSKVFKDEMTTPDPALTESLTDVDFCKVSINQFVYGKTIKHDIYIRLKENKFVKIAHEGEDIPADRIASYKAKGLNFLYLRKEDFKAYVGFTLNLSKLASQSNRIAKAKKVKLLLSSAQLILDQLKLENLSEPAFEDARAVMESALLLTCDSDDLTDALEMVRSHEETIYFHSLAVGFNASLIGQSMGWNSSQIAMKIAMGGLLLDIGIKEMPKEVLSKPVKSLSPEERRIYQSHPIRGAELLAKFRDMPSDVIHIVAQHHENLAGQGYPANLRSKQIHPLARLVSVADRFCTLVLKGPNQPEPINVSEAIHLLCTEEKENLDAPFVAALARSYEVELSKEYLEHLKRKAK